MTEQEVSRESVFQVGLEAPKMWLLKLEII